MGQLGLKMFQSLVEGGMRGANPFVSSKSNKSGEE